MDTKGKIRKQYKKPQVNQIKLEIEEAVLANCKATITPIDTSGKDTSGCNIAKCRTTQGS
jgi:hypothetical protein